ncbi:hypothetical protein [Herminiimonas sp. CN]|uniref:hypothetical protein n=1 Tax=Herminiimonas sp. CN TaxID=1349818 RepID=UPI000473CE98|nr:hypothetical protein [Herminiimonas sp. CN]
MTGKVGRAKMHALNYRRQKTAIQTLENYEGIPTDCLDSAGLAAIILFHAANGINRSTSLLFAAAATA